jgi:ABC-2 type transport system permease protein
MRVFLALLALNFKDIASFRLDAFMKLAGYPIQFGLMMLLWTSLAKQGVKIDLNYLTTYYAISFALLAQYPFLRLAMKTQEVVMTGAYVRNLISGISLPLEDMAEFLAKSTWFNLFSIPCAVALSHGITGTDFDIGSFAGLVVTVILGGVIQALMWILVGLSAFWLVVNTGLVVAFQHLHRLLTGAVIPLSMLPRPVHELLLLTPFPYSLFLPVELYLTRGETFSVLISQQLGWIFVLALIVRLAYLRGINRGSGAML